MFAGDVLSETIFLDSWTLTETLFLVVGLPVGLLLIIALHEGGHTLAGTMSGFRLQHISVGPLKLQHTPEGWRAMRSPHGFFEGMSHSVPGPSLQDAPGQVVRRGRAVRLAGGAAANVLSGGLALGLASILSGGGGATAAALRGDAEAARSWLQRVDPSTDDVPAYALGRAEAATLLAEGEHAEARRRTHDAVAAIDDHPVPGTGVAERAWLHDLQQDVEQGQPYANSPDASPLDANRPHSNPLDTVPS